MTFCISEKRYFVSQECCKTEVLKFVFPIKKKLMKNISVAFRNKLFCLINGKYIV